jgi:uncharacterized protein (DUF934 family)
MPVINQHRIIEDHWTQVSDEETALPGGDIIVSWSRWLKDRERLEQRTGKLGVLIDGTCPVADIGRDADHFRLIALDFAKLGDGRCFTHARLLRERYGYKGELRAVGQVIKDLLFFMQRCGIDSFVLPDDRDSADALGAFSEFSVKYQTAADGAPPIYRQRN